MSGFSGFEKLMRGEGLPAIVIGSFRHYYEQLVAGRTGLIREAEIEPVRSLPSIDCCADGVDAELASAGAAALTSTVVIKLNGGLGTSMGLAAAKSLLPVKDGHSFLDIIAMQAGQAGTPLVLMNSFSTRDDSLAALRAHPDLGGELPLDFMQHKVPKILVEGLGPASCARAPELGWCPPGHGDIYTALVTSGMLETLLAAGYQRAFVSNADNLGAAIDDQVLGHFVQNQLPFMMEVCERTEADRKGGHLARLANGQLILRESAQCDEADRQAFADISRHKFFNTNNLWIDLRALATLMAERDNLLGLAMIRNRKTLDPRDSSSSAVFQLETAMGSAIAVFAGSSALHVPRTRFAPVKTTSDLLAVRSDDYVLDDSFRIVPNPARRGPAAIVDLDPQHYKLIDQLDARFPHGAPSLIDCERLRVRGDVGFGRGIVAIGDVQLTHTGEGRLELPDGSTLR